MPDSSSRLQYLLQQYAHNRCTRAELLELMQALQQNGDPQELKDSLKMIWDELKPGEEPPAINREQIFNNIIGSGKVHKLQPKSGGFKWWAAAAAVLLFGAIGTYYLNQHRVSQVQITKTHQSSGLPGNNEAELTLANGKRIVLSNSGSGNISTDGATTVIRLDKGQLAYSGNLKGGQKGGTAFNTLTTPAGGQYQLVLPDGTRVWLNAASTLRFPAAFDGSSRHVELSGEGYFEVAKNKAKPFSITANGEEIKVLGTHFNVMAYQDEESTNTTLLEGAVQITKGSEVRKLVPGDQARVGENINIVRVDPSEAIEWKNGNFNFAHEKIQSIMRKLSRWYNVDIEYQGTMTAEGFVGTVPRSKSLAEVLSTLESTGLVHFKTEERRVIVMP